MDRSQLEEYARSSLVFYGLDLSRISSVLIAQIWNHELNRSLNVHSIGDELKRIERGSSKKVGMFKHLPLKGLYKAHFFDARFIHGNINAEFGFDYGGNKKLDNVISQAFEQSKSPYSSDEMAMFLAHELTVKTIENRAQKGNLSGEWIVFQIHEGQNYYLALGRHKESDQDIYDRVQAAYRLDFPFLVSTGT
ncbi:hypothetical protein BBM40_19485 [Vibrio parahaemolyticus]|uniref:hypothetical protein n=1 Tax=Vibrio parahaemolyticus TaxID=670 RepID=UPI00084B0614|nr:hypothetical protein [Vibrio parahaemolyticus]ODZ45779.1 hypothetical protein BBM40_19485 [Vibrio parahaemolyticus]